MRPHLFGDLGRRRRCRVDHLLSGTHRRLPLPHALGDGEVDRLGRSVEQIVSDDPRTLARGSPDGSRAQGLGVRVEPEEAEIRVMEGLADLCGVDLERRRHDERLRPHAA